jgi:hypothetical protein
LAQSYEPINAAILGVYLHGLTADIALLLTGTQTFIASDIIKYLGKSFLVFENKSPEKGFSKSYIFNSLNNQSN